MNFKKFISGVSAFAIAASAFAAMAVTANAAVGDTTNLATVDFDDGTTGADTTLSTNADGRLVIGKGSAAVTVDDSKIGATDQVEVKFKLAFGKLVNRNVYFNMKDADNNEIASFTFNPYAGSLTNTLGIVTDDMYYASNTVIWDRNVQFDIIVDYFTGKITTNTSCLKSGAGKAATTAQHVTDLPSGVGALKTFTVGSNYENEGRMCQIDDIVIDAIEGEDAQPVAYTFNYYNGATLVNSESSNAAVGATVNATIPFTKDGVKYYAADGATTSITLDADATKNVVNVPVRVANNYTVSLKSSIDNAVVASKSVVEGESSGNIYYNKYILDGTTLYSTSALSDGNKQYAYAFSNVTDNAEYTLNYTAVQGECVFFTEAEDIDGWSLVNDTARMSGGKGGYIAEESKVATLPAGKYVVKVGTRGSTDASYTIKAGTAELISIDMHGYIEETASDEFVLNEETDITAVVNGGSSNKGIDYIYIMKTGDYVAPVENKAEATVGEGAAYTVADGYDKDMVVGVISLEVTGSYDLANATYEGNTGDVSDNSSTVITDTTASVIVVINGATSTDALNNVVFN